jgi:myxalamid-type polyketide synthase MxaB
VIVAAPERDTESQKDAETDEGAADGRRLPPATVERTRHLLALSAKHETALVALAQRYQAHLHDQPTVDLGDLCYTAAVGRNHFSRRLAIVAADREELQAKLALVAQRERVSGLVFGESPAGAQNIAFLFTGQGAQYVDMGRELYATQPLFRAAIEQCDAFYQQNTGESLLAVLYPEIEHMPHARVLEGRNSLDDTTYTQPALFALEYALATLWRAWGVQPDILIGHSVGEIAAACVAGVFSLEDGMKLTAARGRLMGALPHDGAMIAVTATEATVQQAIASYADRVAIAAVNGPTTIVISGQQDAVNAVAAALTTENDAGPQPSIKTLTVSHAFHSPLMEPMLDDLRQVAQQLTYHAPSIPLISNLTGQLAGAEITTPDYWVRHVREAVRFADGIATLDGQNVAIFLEIGPKPVLLGMARDMLDHKATGAPRSTASTAALWLPSLRAGQNDWERLLQSLGELYVHGVQIDWAVLDQGYLRRKVALPTYPFQRQRYWVEPPPMASSPPKDTQQGGAGLRPLIHTMTQSPLLREILFETVIGVETLPFLADHRIDERIVAPGACHLAMVLSAAELALRPAVVARTSPASPTYQLADVIFPQALALTDETSRRAHLLFTPSAPQAGSTKGPSPNSTAASFQLITFVEAGSSSDSTPAIHATGTVAVHSAEKGRNMLPSPTLAALQERYTEMIPQTADQETPLHFGPAFRWLDTIWRAPADGAHGDNAGVLTQLRRPAAVPSLAGYLLHPALLDACFQTVGVAYQFRQVADELLLPFALETLLFYETAPESATAECWWCHVQPAEGAKWQIHLFDGTGQLLATIHNFELRAAPQIALQTAQVPTEWIYTLSWEAAALPPTPTSATPDRWLLVGVLGALRDGLVQHLQATGRPVLTASADDTLRQVVMDLTATSGTLGVVYLGGLEATAAELTVAAHAYQLCRGLLQLTQALLSTERAVQLWVVTQGCHPIDHEQLFGGEGATPGFTAAAMGALWGLGRTIAQEQPQVHCVCIDLETDNAAQQVGLLSQEFLAPVDAAERAGQVAYRRQSRYVARLAPWQATHPSASTAEAVRLQLQEYGSLEQLAFVPLTRRPPQANEIEVAVKAVGLNFRDVLNALGLLKEYYAALGIVQPRDLGLGFEFAGRVSAVGTTVTEFAVGDRVMGLATLDGAFASYLTLPATGVVAIPDAISDEQAATLPMAFLTAWYGLVELARLQPGERVLIHAAAGGVGQAAVQIAHALGAEVIGSASPAKWEVLHQQGVAHVLNSRTFDFSAELLRLTDGAGVDVVLNSLNGDFIPHSLAALGQRGRFVEIGKLGIWSHAQMAQARPDVAYYPFDLGEAIMQDPTLQTRLWKAVSARLADRTLQPLPHVRFPYHETVAAFRYMQQAKQIGKIVVSFEQAAPLVIHQDASYLITGGLGALGLHIAQQLVADGARHLILTSRHGASTAAQHTTLDALTAAGATLTLLQADIGNGDAVAELIHQCTAVAPLRGIVHAAGGLDDGVLTAQTPDRLAAVMRPKVDGAWHLHCATQTLALDFFVCFSSISALVGTPGQSNYAAANAFMDTLMQQRRRLGLPGLSINWGPWAGANGLRGMAADLQERMQAQGVTLIAPYQGRLLFRYLLEQPVAQLAVLPLQRQQSMAQLTVEAVDWRKRLADLPAGARPAQLASYLRTEIATVLGLRGEMTFDPRTRLFEFGLDSLMAVELKNRLEVRLVCNLRSTLLFDYPTLEALTGYLLQSVLNFGEETPAASGAGQPATENRVQAVTPASLEPTAIALDELSVEDLIALIAKEDQDFS